MQITNAHKKEVERHMLRRFISHESHGLRIMGIDDGETPDFTLRELEKTISVELTRVILPALKEQEMFQERLVTLAWQKFKEKYPDKLQVLVNFSNEIIRCSFRELGKYADQLLEVVEPIFLTNRRYEFRVSSIGRESPINNFIDSIAISNDLALDNWQPFGAFRVNTIDSNIVLNTIKAKEKNIPLYKRGYDENWLLLLANFGHESSTHDFDYSSLRQHKSKFDRIYLYRYIENSYTQIQ